MLWIRVVRESEFEGELKAAYDRDSGVGRVGCKRWMATEKPRWGYRCWRDEGWVPPMVVSGSRSVT